MERLTLAGNIKSVAQLTGEFTLRSGAVSNVYFDKYQFESDPRLLRAIAAALAELIPASTEVLCGLEMGGIPIANALSLHTGLPAAFIRKTPKPYGTQRYAEGPPLANKQLLLVEDVVSSGGAIVNTVNMLRDDGITVSRALCVIDRESGGREALAEIGITLDHLFTMAEIDRAPNL